MDAHIYGSWEKNSLTGGIFLEEKGVLFSSAVSDEIT
jgi:hypothetical protein